MELKSRASWIRFAMGAAVLLLAVWGSRSARAEGLPPAAGAAGPAWPANVEVIEAKLAPSEFEKPEFQLRLPQLRVYDGKGRLLLDQTGYDKEHFAAQMGKSLQGKPLAGSKGDPLAEELKRFLGKDGKPLGAPPPQAVRIVEWWADWCVPCHSQAQELAKVLAAKPETRVALYRVEASRPNFSGKPIKLDDSKLTDEMLRKLNDPKVSPAEKQRIIEAARVKDDEAKPEAPPPPHP